MTLIKKIKQAHAGATTANLLAMALMMSAVGCGCGDDEDSKDGNKALEMNIEAEDPKPAKSATEATIEVKITVKEGTLKPAEWKINMKDVKLLKNDGNPSAATIKWDQDTKTLKEAGVDELKKDAKGSFKLKATPTGKAFDGAGDLAKVTASLEIEGKIKNSKGVEEPKVFKQAITITAGS
jgi:hypothetical protein